MLLPWESVTVLAPFRALRTLQEAQRQALRQTDRKLEEFLDALKHQEVRLTARTAEQWLGNSHWKPVNRELTAVVVSWGKEVMTRDLQERYYFDLVDVGDPCDWRVYLDAITAFEPPATLDLTRYAV